MKKYINIAVKMSVFYSSISLGMELSSSERYFVECRKIDEMQEEKLTRFIQYACSTDLLREMKKVENKLLKLRSVYEERWNDVLFSIKKKYHISGDLWHDCLRLAKDTNEIEKKNNNKPLLHTQHDKEIPRDMMMMLNKYFNVYGMHPQRCTLSLSNNQKNANPVCFSIRTNKEDSLFLDEMHAAHIVIPRSVLDCSVPIKEGLCLLLVNQVNDISRERDYIIKFLRYSTDLLQAEKNIEIKPEDVQKLAQSNYTLSVFNAALHNEYNATILNVFHKIDHVEMFSYKDYKELSTIKRLHQTLSWFKCYASKES